MLDASPHGNAENPMDLMRGLTLANLAFGPGVQAMACVCSVVIMFGSLGSGRWWLMQSLF
jgi:hypothetical protein